MILDDESITDVLRYLQVLASQPGPPGPVVRIDSFLVFCVMCYINNTNRTCNDATYCNAMQCNTIQYNLLEQATHVHARNTCHCSVK